MPRTMWSKMTLEKLCATPSAPAWQEIRKRMHAMDISYPSSRALIESIAESLKDWPRHVSRPPMSEWKRPDPRLAACLVIHETATYNDYRAGLSLAFRLSNGLSAIKLRRRYVGMAVDPSGNEISVNKRGEADTSGRFILEPRPGVYIAVTLSVEAKMDGGDVRDNQVKEAAEIIADGGIAVIAVGVEDAIAQITPQRDELLRRIRS